MKNIQIVAILIISLLLLYFCFCIFQDYKMKIPSHIKEDLPKVINILCKSNKEKCIEIGRIYAKKNYTVNMFFNTNDIKNKQDLCIISDDGFVNCD